MKDKNGKKIKNGLIVEWIDQKGRTQIGVIYKNCWVKMAHSMGWKIQGTGKAKNLEIIR